MANLHKSSLIIKLPSWYIQYNNLKNWSDRLSWFQDTQFLRSPINWIFTSMPGHLNEKHLQSDIENKQLRIFFISSWDTIFNSIIHHCFLWKPHVYLLPLCLFYLYVPSHSLSISFKPISCRKQTFQITPDKLEEKRWLHSGSSLSNTSLIYVFTFPDVSLCLWNFL